MDRKMKKGFTLAEVLVTLAIIGVVAALTIPAVVHKFQQQELYTRFIRTYNIFNNVYFQLKTEGLIDDSISGQSETVKERILSLLKYNIKCEANDGACYKQTYLYYKRFGPDNTKSIGITSGDTTYELPNGAVFQFTNNGINNFSWYVIRIDTNGIEKGPNIVGRDFFELYFYPYQKSPGFSNACYAGFTSTWRQAQPVLKADISSIEAHCNPKIYDSEQNCCGLKMLLEHKMSY